MFVDKTIEYVINNSSLSALALIYRCFLFSCLQNIFCVIAMRMHALTASTRNLHNWRSCATLDACIMSSHFSLQSSFMLFKSSQLFFGRPWLLFPSTLSYSAIYGSRLPSILDRCPKYLTQLLQYLDVSLHVHLHVGLHVHLYRVQVATN